MVQAKVWRFYLKAWVDTLRENFILNFPHIYYPFHQIQKYYEFSKNNSRRRHWQVFQNLIRNQVSQYNPLISHSLVARFLFQRDVPCNSLLRGESWRTFSFGDHYELQFPTTQVPWKSFPFCNMHLFTMNKKRL